MTRSQNREMAAVAELQKRLRVIQSGVQAVLATSKTPGMLLPTDDSQYEHVYLLNVPAETMMDVEDAAHDIWREVAPAADTAVTFFIYTPTETADRFPRYCAAQMVRPDCETLRSLMAASQWLAATPYQEPQRESWELVRLSQQMATLPSFSRDGVKSQAVYRPVYAADVELCAELPKAA